MFSLRYHRKSHYFLRWTLAVCIEAALCIPVCVLSVRGQGNILSSLAVYLLLFFISLVGPALCYQESVWSIILCGVSGYTTQHLTAQICLMALWNNGWSSDFFYPYEADAILWVGNPGMVEHPGETIAVTVAVKNTGDTAGKDVVQIYYTAPYTQLDEEYRIEKSAVNLAAFGKTGLLQPGEQEKVTLTFDKEDMASYCYTRDNGDGTTGCYVLEAGAYTVSLRANSHDVPDSRDVAAMSTEWFDNTNPRQSEKDAQSALDENGQPLGYPADGADKAFQAATNQFQESSDYMLRESSLLTRSDWENTFPVIAEGRTKEASDTGLKIGDLATCAWMSKPVVASTWNTELIYEMGCAVGQEALTDGLNGWYAPGMNIHRSPFSRRNLEYFSEDPVLTGKLAAALISGCGDQCLYCFVKHFAVNDQETNRQFFLTTWADEQTMGEIYLKAFEIAFKEARMSVKYISDDQGTVSVKVMPAATGVMTARSCIGTTICFANYGLLTGVLRGEWGFNGSVITNLHFVMEPWLRDKMLRAGGDMYLMMNMDQLRIPAGDCGSATARSLIRETIHHISYMEFNSAVMNHTAPSAIVTYDTSPWVYLLVGIDIVAGVFIVFMVTAILRRRKDNRLHPEKYRAG